VDHFQAMPNRAITPMHHNGVRAMRALVALALIAAAAPAFAAEDLHSQATGQVLLGCLSNVIAEREGSLAKDAMIADRDKQIIDLKKQLADLQSKAPK
jgi:hypothetical protein